MDKIGKLADDLTQEQGIERRRKTAARLRDAGFAQRTSLEKRGTLAQPAESDLESHELESLHAALGDDDREVRRQAIVSTGDLGDATSVPALLPAVDDRDIDIRLAAIDSLGDIGGLECLRTLTRLARDSSEDQDVRLAALTELEELAAKPITSGPDRWFDPPQDPEQPAPEAAATDDTVEASDATTALHEALTSIESDEEADELLRLKAADVRAYTEGGLA